MDPSNKKNNSLYLEKNMPSRRVSLVQLVRLSVVELIHLNSNPRFNMCVVFTANYSFSGRRHLHQQRYALGDRLRESQDQADSVFQMCS
jgi:hypothetical protein